MTKAELAGRSVIISFDANSKMGPKYIPGDPHSISENGKVIEGILERHALSVGNGLAGKSRGTITRARNTVDGEEKSVIDLILLSSDLVDNLEEILIDEEKKFGLESIIKSRNRTEVKKSDHNSIITKFNFKWNKEIKKNRVEHFNLKSKEGLVKFKELTSQDIFTSIVNKEQDANTLTNKFLKRLNGVICESFKKIRIRNKIKMMK